ncbi:uncharacterized protein [Triticum aestivum]|uniref:uncharacterized protein n=1 Tax=Triticum aestivum TaxID=4565 RepID=UPI001D02AF4B|nr:uncharacterized protein LOC123112374 [Triticum aestivum]
MVFLHPPVPIPHSTPHCAGDERYPKSPTKSLGLRGELAGDESIDGERRPPAKDSAQHPTGEGGTRVPEKEEKEASTVKEKKEATKLCAKRRMPRRRDILLIQRPKKQRASQ